MTFASFTNDWTSRNWLLLVKRVICINFDRFSSHFPQSDFFLVSESLPYHSLPQKANKNILQNIIYTMFILKRKKWTMNLSHSPTGNLLSFVKKKKGTAFCFPKPALPKKSFRNSSTLSYVKETAEEEVVSSLKKPAHLEGYQISSKAPGSNCSLASFAQILK